MPDLAPPEKVSQTRSSPLARMVSARDGDTVRIVHDAIAAKRIMLAYQPIVQSVAPEQAAFYEGLVRVVDRQGRIVPARDFMDVVANQEAGRKLDTIALEKGLEALAQVPDLRLSINMSARSIAYPPWRAALDAALALDPTIGERLILEITEETAISMPDLVQVFMADLQMKGISFALDNFGAGHSSFHCLRDFYFDILKIDGSFTRNVHESPDNRVMAEAIISLARHFEMFTVAERVETWEDAECLAEMGIDCMQGYFFGMPTITPYWVESDPRRAMSA